MSHHIGLQILRAKIRGFQSTGMTITARIGKAEKERKNRLWNQKRSLGYHCRHHLIAYGLLRGVPYDQVERCAPNNRPDPKLVLDIVVAHNRWTPEKGLVSYDLEKVKQYLTTSTASTASTSTAASSTASSTKPPATSGATLSPGPTAVPTLGRPESPRGLLEGARRLLGRLG